MADVIQQIQFKRGTKENLTLVLNDEYKLASGEPAYETDTGKIKIGNGRSNYVDLPYISGGSSSQDIFIEGYYLDNKFYIDSTYQIECEKDNQKIYINKNSLAEEQATNFIDCYRYYGDLIGFRPIVSLANDLKPGLVKLYKTCGINEDGTMTQKAITNGVSSIKFEVESTGSENVLVLGEPWVN